MPPWTAGRQESIPYDAATGGYDRYQDHARWRRSGQQRTAAARQWREWLWLTVGGLNLWGRHTGEAIINDVAQLLQAIEFSAYKHRVQRRKDADASPYINHPIGVATLLAIIGLAVLAAAVLHDTMEDTETTPAELEERFGPEVRALVEEMTDDKRLPKADRKRLQVEHAPGVSANAKLIKLADKIVNLRDVCTTPPSDWSLERRREYLDWTRDVIAGCGGVNPGLEAFYDEALTIGRHKLDLGCGGGSPGRPAVEGIW